MPNKDKEIIQRSIDNLSINDLKLNDILNHILNLENKIYRLKNSFDDIRPKQFKKLNEISNTNSKLDENFLAKNNLKMEEHQLLINEAHDFSMSHDLSRMITEVLKINHDTLLDLTKAH